VFELELTAVECRSVARAVVLLPPRAAVVPVSSLLKSYNALSTRRDLGPFTACWRGGCIPRAATCPKHYGCRCHRPRHCRTRSLERGCWRRCRERQPEADDQQPQPLEDSPT
jgi:hypothetical protein